MLSWLWEIREDEDRHSLYSMPGSSICTFEMLGHDLGIVDDSQRGLSRLQSAIRLLKIYLRWVNYPISWLDSRNYSQCIFVRKTSSFLQNYKKGVMKNSMNKNELKLPLSKGHSMPSNIKISIRSLTIMKDTRHPHSPDPPGNHNWLDAVLIICISFAFMLGSFSKFNRPCGSISSRWVH